MPGTQQHLDLIRIRSGDTVTQSGTYSYTLGLYYLEQGGAHIFADEADIAALDVAPQGRWLAPSHFEPLITVRNARSAYIPPHADIEHVYECELFCLLLANPFYPYSTLPPCVDSPCQ